MTGLPLLAVFLVAYVAIFVIIGAAMYYALIFSRAALQRAWRHRPIVVRYGP